MKNTDKIKELKLITIAIRLSQNDIDKIDSNAKKSKLSRSSYIRKRCSNYEIKEKPDDRFYEVIKLLRKIIINQEKIIGFKEAFKKFDADKYG